MGKRVILVGAGGFGATWHRALAHIGAQVVAVAEPVAAVAVDAAHRYRLPADHLFDGRDLTWANVDADWVIDSAPPLGRKDRLLAALGRGKNCISAKPALLNLEEVAAVRDAERRTGRCVFVAMQKRYFPAFRGLRTALRQGRLGRIEYVGIRLEVDGTVWESGMEWRRGLAYASLVEGAIHHIDLLEWLLGPEVLSVQATGWNPSWSAFGPCSDFAATLRCDDDLVIQYLSRWSARGGGVSHYFSGLRFEGTAGTAEVVDGRLYLDRVYAPLIDDGPSAMDLARLNCDLLDEVMSARGTECARSSGLDLATHGRVLETMMAIMSALQAADANGVVVGRTGRPERAQF